MRGLQRDFPRIRLECGSPTRRVAAHNPEIGVGLTGLGLGFMILGILMFFDRGFMAIGNVVFLGGLTLIIGLQKTLYFFTRREKLRGTVCFFGGVLLVLLSWPFVGVCIELFGFINLFGYFSLTQRFHARRAVVYSPAAADWAGAQPAGHRAPTGPLCGHAAARLIFINNS